MDYRIIPPQEMLEARPALPLSKSISNRLLIIDALTPGSGELPALSEAADTVVLHRALATTHGTVNIDGAGTAMRFLTAYYAATEGADVTLDGNERMRTRPIKPLVDALRTLGADIEYPGTEGCPPLHIRGRRLSGGELNIDSAVSSQFISALLMVAPTMASPLVLHLGPDTVSMPYIRMTLGMMEARGIDCDMEDADTIRVAPGTYTRIDTPVEPDWSAAAAWYEIQALAMGSVQIPGLMPDSIQGDACVARIFEDLGVHTEFDEGEADLQPSPEQLPRLNIDMTDCPDLVPSVAVSAAMLGIPFRLTGLSTLRVKECDRIEAIVAEMERVGLLLTAGPDYLAWELKRRPIAELPEFDTYGDHRMAMALAPISLFIPGIVVRDVEVVEKSYPGYWDELRAAGFTLLDPAEPFTPEQTESPEAITGADPVL